MIDNARKIADVNGMSDKITFLKGRVEDAKLPQVDIIISEWMGFCLLSEIMLDCLLQARDKFLVPGGLMFPDKCSLYVSGIEDAKRLSGKVDCKYRSSLKSRVMGSTDFFVLSEQDWDNVYGLDFSPVKAAAISKGFLRTPEPGALVTEPACVLDLDLQSIQVSDPVLKSIPFRLVADREDTVHAFLAWFDYDFTKGHQPVHVTTGPFTPPTHWKQTVFYLENPIHLEKDTAIHGKVSFEQYQRDLNVRFWYGKEVKDLHSIDSAALPNGREATGGYGLYKV